jgi:hypothetical protein
MHNSKIETTKESSTFALIPMITLINFGEPGLVNGTLNYTIYKDEEVVWSELENVTFLGQRVINKPISANGLGVGGCTFEVVYVCGGNVSKHTCFFHHCSHPTDPAPSPPPVVAIILAIVNDIGNRNVRIHMVP